MSISPNMAPHLYQELAHERIRALHQEAEEQRQACRLSSVLRAQRKVEQAAARLSAALLRV